MKGMIGVVIAMMTLALAPTANADQYSFVNTLDSKGVYYGDILTIIESGKLVCSSLRRGATVDQSFDYLNGQDYSDKEGTIIILAAVKEMCPDQGPTLRAYADGA